MAKTKIEVAECCPACKRSMFAVTGNGLEGWGKCYDTRKVKSVQVYNVCAKYARRDDIFSADRLRTNSIANPVKGLRLKPHSIHDGS
jgi:hypothetical protein